MDCRGSGLCFLASLFFAYLNAAAQRVHWPTPDSSFFAGALIQDVLQPTASGRLDSALFGCVRNSGYRFHEGLDLKSIHRDKRGESVDRVYAVMSGRVAYVNNQPGKSSYGCYVVLEHPSRNVSVYTLYAHLTADSIQLKQGMRVNAGDVLGTMGRTAGGYVIPKQRAHLHFELGVRLTEQFDKWYARQSYEFENFHGNYNGRNLIGMDPVKFFKTVRQGDFTSFEDYIKSLSTAFTVRVGLGRVPDFVRRYPRLLSQKIPENGLVGWEIEFTWYGLPKKWTPLKSLDMGVSANRKLTLISYDSETLEERCRGLLEKKSGRVRMSEDLAETIRLLFAYP